MFTKSACAIVDEEYYYAPIGQIYDVCTEWRNSVLDQLELERPHVVIIGNSSTYDFNERQWIQGTRRVLNRVSKLADVVFVIPGTPSLGFNEPGCVAKNIKLGGAIDGDTCIAQDRVRIPQDVSSYLHYAATPFPKCPRSRFE